jgi:hypothetical protein
MNAKMWSCLTAVLVGLGWLMGGSTARAQYYQSYFPSYQLNRLFYYPYYYFPHNYWPVTSPQWPEGPGMPYQRPPAYMAYPAFREQGWRYDLFHNMRYYSGSHFWLDQF